MAGLLTDEPSPRQTARWTPFAWPVGPGEALPPPWHGPDRPFDDVALSRRSRLGDSVDMAAAGNLLHHLTKDLRPMRKGRAGLPVHQRVTPSAGGLHPYAFVCLGDRDRRAMLYDAAEHSFRPLEADHAALAALNAAQVEGLLGRAPGVTARIVMDRSLVAAAYDNPDTLILRDAGALLAVASMLAEWLGLLACPLGFMGGDFVERLKLPPNRFIAAGGFQISTDCSRS